MQYKMFVFLNSLFGLALKESIEEKHHLIKFCLIFSFSDAFLLGLNSARRRYRVDGIG